MTPKKQTGSRKSKRTGDVSTPTAGDKAVANTGDGLTGVDMELGMPLPASTADNILATLMGNSAAPLSLPGAVVTGTVPTGKNAVENASGSGNGVSGKSKKGSSKKSRSSRNVAATENDVDGGDNAVDGSVDGLGGGSSVNPNRQQRANNTSTTGTAKNSSTGNNSGRDKPSSSDRHNFGLILAGTAGSGATSARSARSNNADTRPQSAALKKGPIAGMAPNNGEDRQSSSSSISNAGGGYNSKRSGYRKGGVKNQPTVDNNGYAGNDDVDEEGEGEEDEYYDEHGEDAMESSAKKRKFEKKALNRPKRQIVRSSHKEKASSEVGAGEEEGDFEGFEDGEVDQEDDEEEFDDEDEDDDDESYYSDEDEEDSNFKAIKDSEFDLDGISLGSSQVGGVAGISMVVNMKNEIMKRIDDMEVDLKKHHLFTYLISDLRSSVEHTKNRVDRLIASVNINTLLSDSVFKKIEQAGILWTKVYGELLFGLENLKNDVGEESFAGSTGKFSASSSQSSVQKLNTLDENSSLGSLSKAPGGSIQPVGNPFLGQCTELVSLIEQCLELFSTVDNSLPLTLERLNPKLEQIYNLASELLIADDNLKKNNEIGGASSKLYGNFNSEYSFDDILCSDLKANMRKLVEEATTASFPILDEGIAKVQLQQRMTALERNMDNKVSKPDFDKNDHEVRHLVKKKVGHEEFVTVTSKLASVAELMNMKNRIMDAVGMGGSALGGGMGADGTRLNSRDNSFIAVNNEEMKELRTRFELLSKQYQDVHSFCSQFIPRDEVHEVMRTVVAEMKMLKNNCVRESLFNEAMKKKADADELQAIVFAISGAIGDLNLNTTNEGNWSSAVHAKCLLCDKPVLGVLNNLQKKGGNNNAAINNAAAVVPSNKMVKMNEAANSSRPTSSFPINSNKNSPSSKLQSMSVANLREKVQLQGGFPQLASGPSEKIAAVVDAYHNQRPRTSPTNTLLQQRMLQQQQQPEKDSRDSSMLARLASQNVAVSKSERAKVVSELAIIRNSIDILPEINVRRYVL
mmetsp:Transcript_10794/g.14860  ORF Transcript_10794/g.14860 Transcript_10794/m.14860 type:complete len:1028 (+) Transcript_10794:137-3220(+)